VILLVGSERGFCGDFNEALIRQLDRNSANDSAQTIVVGSRLRDHLPEGFEVAATLENASTVEEVDRVLVHLTDTLSRLMSAQGRLHPPQVRVIHHQAAGQDVRETILQPMRAGSVPSSKFAFPPDLTLDPPAFAEGLIEQYLFARLHELLYSSLMVENQVRVQHMEAAVERLDRSFSELTRRRNILRQEEITQEIEVIMLSAGAFG
jgi:F-type H+-transporting ATPase subunit gamma